MFGQYSKDLAAKQYLLELLNTSYPRKWQLDGIRRIIGPLDCELQPAIVADLLQLECSSQEWHVLEYLADLLSPSKQASEYLSSEKYPTITVVGPLLSAIKAKIVRMISLLLERLKRYWLLT